MFMWSNKGKRIMATIIAVIMFLAMVVPLAMDMFI